MLKKRIIFTLTFYDGVLFRTKKFKPDYRYTKNFLDLWSIDELVIIDISKEKFSNKFLDLVKYFSLNCYVPITVGGGIEKISHVDEYFKYGADKILLGYRALENNEIIKEISMKYGSQSIIQALDCKKNFEDNYYYITKNSGQEFLSKDIFLYTKQSLDSGAGEILINNVDNDGSLLGYDIDLIDTIKKNINAPLLALGGAGNWDHVCGLFKKTEISAACTQNIYHFTEESIISLKKYLFDNDINVRK